MNEHILEKFDAELDKLRARLIKMGTLVQQQIEYTIKAIREEDKNLASIIIKNDDKIDKIDIKIDKHCMRIFVQLQPVATDLRTTMSALSINDNMELIGDILVDIANNLIKMPPVPPHVKADKTIEFGKTVENMIKFALDSFIYADSELSHQVVEISRTAKSQFYDAFDYSISAIKSDISNTEYASYLNDINRNLKFISDLAINIAHEIIFIVDAKIVKHNYSQLRKELNDEESQESNQNN